jgi:hypothetical protein
MCRTPSHEAPAESRLTHTRTQTHTFVSLNTPHSLLTRTNKRSSLHLLIASLSRSLNNNNDNNIVPPRQTFDGVDSRGCCEACHSGDCEPQADKCGECDGFLATRCGKCKRMVTKAGYALCHNLKHGGCALVPADEGGDVL